jgi:hypothetical protein
MQKNECDWPGDDWRNLINDALGALMGSCKAVDAWVERFLASRERFRRDGFDGHSTNVIQVPAESADEREP